MPDSEGKERYEAYRSVRHFGSLDGLRFLCIAMVMWHHGPLYAAMDDPALIFRRGFTGVDFFFVLSGFLITTLLLREEARDGRFSLRGFYRRRILRIVPVYFLVVTAVSLWWIVGRGQNEWLSYAPYYYLFLANFLNDDIPLLSITWSLSVEEQYYLVWPMLLLLLPAVARVRTGVVVVLITFCVLVAMGILPEAEILPPTEEARFRLPVSSYAAILIGSLLGIILHSPAGFAIVWKCLGNRFAPVLALIAVAVALAVLPTVLRGWPNLVLHSLMAVTLASLVVREDHALAGVLQWRLVARIGQISYGLYLYHLIGRHIGVEAAQALGVNSVFEPWLAMIIFVLASVAIADVSFRTFEAHFLRLKNKRPRRAAVPDPGE